MSGACTMHGENTEMCIKFQSEILKRRGHLEDLGVDEKIILEQILGK
jgi:hypothetical protein